MGKDQVFDFFGQNFKKYTWSANEKIANGGDKTQCHFSSSCLPTPSHHTQTSSLIYNGVAEHQNE